jgi:hypothetical protein
MEKSMIMPVPFWYSMTGRGIMCLHAFVQISMQWQHLPVNLI